MNRSNDCDEVLAGITSQKALSLIAPRRIIRSSFWKPTMRSEVIRIECRGIGAGLQ